MRSVAVIAFGMVAGLAFVALASTTVPPSTPLQVGSEATLPDSGPDDTGTTPDGPIFDGGSDATFCNQNPITTGLCGEAGTNGCAGFGGEGGVGGQGGGAAIPLYIIGNSHVTIANGAFFVARGGQGGPGGDGGTGSNGHDGPNGSGVQCHSACDLSCNAVGGGFLEGGAGGTGKNGGSGGLGGGGAGGPIYFYAYVDAAAPSITPSTLTGSVVIDGGGPGQGGSPNGKTGAQGVSFP